MSTIAPLVDSPSTPVTPDPRGSRPLRFLFAKNQLVYPRSRGHDIRAFNMMRQLAALGHSVGLATFTRASDSALNGLRLDYRTALRERAASTSVIAPLTRTQARLASYFGASLDDLRALADATREMRAEVLIGLGPDILPFMAGTSGVRRVWYAADEWVSHYCSLVKMTQPRTWGQLGTAAIWGVYERAFVPGLDRVWVVSDPEEHAMRRWAGARHVDVLPNGVDADYFAPQTAVERERSAVFWGRLDWSPNLQALEWFCVNVWPLVRQRFPDAAFRIIGFGAGTEARALAQQPGVSLSADLDDLRATVAEHAVVVMPFHSGGGIKNKLLEAAAMAKPLVCTPTACHGLRGDPPVVLASSPLEWVEALGALWSDADARHTRGRDARDWVTREHSWRRTATDALTSLRGSLQPAD